MVRQNKQAQCETGHEDLPIRDYEHLPVRVLRQRLGDLSHDEVDRLRRFEETHKNRKTMLKALDEFRIPIQDYDHLHVSDIRSCAGKLTRNQLERVFEYEKTHKNRKGVLRTISRELDDRRESAPEDTAVEEEEEAAE